MTRGGDRIPAKLSYVPMPNMFAVAVDVTLILLRPAVKLATDNLVAG